MEQMNPETFFQKFIWNINDTELRDVRYWNLGALQTGEEAVRTIESITLNFETDPGTNDVSIIYFNNTGKPEIVKYDRVVISNPINLMGAISTYYQRMEFNPPVLLIEELTHLNYGTYVLQFR